MKLSRTAKLILGIAIFAVALGSLYALYSRQSDDEHQLKDNIVVAQATLSKIISQKEQLESQLAQLESKLTQQLNTELAQLNTELAQLNTELTQWESELDQAISQLNAARGSLPESVESIEYDERLFVIAKGWDLEITSLTASEPSSRTVKDVTYFVTDFTIEVQGKPAELSVTTEEKLKEYIYETVDDILAFINEIITDDDFSNATVKLMDMKVPEPLIDQEKESAVASATIKLDIYSYEGE